MPEIVAHSGDDGAVSASNTYSRRAALKRGAVVGGALVWAVPTVTVISMSAASAESPSVPPDGTPPTYASPPSSSTPNRPVGSGGPAPQSTPAAPQAVGAGGPLPKAATPPQASSPAALAYTGFPTAEVAIGGAGLLAAGVAMSAAARKNAKPAPESTDQV